MTARGARWLPCAGALGSITAAGLWAWQQYRQAAFAVLSRFCDTAVYQHPETRDALLETLKTLQTDPTRGDPAYLAAYGYRAADLALAVAPVWMLVLGLVLAVTALCLAGPLLWRDRRQKQRIAALTACLEQVNTGGGTLALQQREDAFSPLQDELYKTVTELYHTRESALQARQNFADNLANIAHQLKTPLTAAFLSLQLAERDGTPVQNLRRPLERLARLEEALLTLSRVEAGTLPLDRQPVDLYTALTLAAENLEDLLAQRQVTVDLPDQGCVTVTGDLEWTMQALLNLLKNCMEHTPAGGAVHCRYGCNPLYAQVEIWDEGEGFAPEDLPHLFQRFYRGHSGTEGGLGIGLALSRSILARQNAVVTAANRARGGGCFTVRFYSH